MASTVNALTSGGGLAVSGDTSGSLQLQTNNGTTAMTIDTSQNVGIGTTSPQGKLAVSASGAQGIEFLMSSATAIGVQSYNRNTSAYIDQAYVGSVFSWTTGGVGERMRIDSSGNVQIGSTGGTTRLNVYGTSGSATSLIQVGANGNTGILFTNASGGTAGYITVNSGTVAYNTSSDYRLKENIAPMQNALDKVAKLKPVTYTWKSTGEESQGFIAHELQEVVPDCVTGEKDATRIVDELDAEGKVIGQKEEPVYQGIDTSFLVATLTAAIQEQQAIITDLKARIETLEGAKA